MTKTEFNLLVKEWRDATAHLSNIKIKSLHPAYQQIIAAGQDVIPFILNDLKENGPDDWFFALTKITGENPLNPHTAGIMRSMTDAWLQWGIKRGYLI